MKKRSIWKYFDINNESNSLFRLKDHEETLTSNPTARSLKPAQRELGKVSKVILDRGNVRTGQYFDLIREKITQNAIDQFRTVAKKIT